MEISLRRNPKTKGNNANGKILTTSFIPSLELDVYIKLISEKRNTEEKRIISISLFRGIDTLFFFPIPQIIADTKKKNIIKVLSTPRGKIGNNIRQYKEKNQSFSK
tara:strand:+ start:5449 stop:5766 length:318 start_codon:yes stop_codon:yes gene_type:complete